jgi:ATP-dependent DNA helicase RecG
MSNPHTENIAELIAQGENNSIEFKSSQVRAESVAKEMVAFSNMQGGVLLIGIEDTGEVTGLSSDQLNMEEWLANIARENVLPAIEPSIEKIKYLGKSIIKVDVQKGRDKPYQTNKHQFLVRIGSTNRTASQAELMRLFQQSGVFHYDRLSVDGTSIKDLNFTKIDNYFDRYQIDFSNEDNPEIILSNTDILDVNRTVTIAGLLIFGINPQRYLSDACISFAHFSGTGISDELIDKQVINGTLDQQIDTALAVIKNNLKKSSKIEGTKRLDTSFQYPDKIFRELLVNACVHRNYAISGSRIRIFMFEDRLEFISPGRLPNTITVEKLKAGVSYASNPVIVKFMENLRYIDKLGRGLPLVYMTAMQNNKNVVFEEIGEEFKVSLEL